MTKQINVAGNSQPTAHIAVNKNRIKHYGSTVYLKNGSNFEIELFNPNQYKVAAKISINGINISSSLISLKPGERVYLQRWIDQPKKFVYETYFVENSDEVNAAIKNNGLVKVEFYDQLILPQSNPHIMDLVYCGPNLYNYPGTSSNSCYFSSNSFSNLNETGLVGKGADSNQQFSSDYTNFSTFSSNSVEIKILPESKLELTSNMIRNYCHDCGTRLKNQSWKFCPSCGTQIK
jgi:hypothetical protein